ncbi:MAG TPA: glycosyltransferase [Solirubrobacteraceae bacterium]|nr:glycosyltransferase [Solirubrobacteraceae bacterium]
MRIVFVLDQWPELSETFVVNELQALRRTGHSVRVQAARRAPHVNPEAPADVDVDLLDDDARRRSRDLLWLAARRPLACIGDLVRRRRWRSEEWVRPLRALAPAARRIVERDDEHLHAHFAAGAALDALRLARLTGRPYSVTAHAYDIFAQPRNLREKLERAALVFTGCDYNVVRLRELAPAADVHEIVMGVDAGAFRRTRPLAGGRRVLAVARLVEKKGLDVLVEAAARLRDVEVLVIGDGPLRHALEDRIAQTGAPVRLLGDRPPAQVAEAMQDADVLAMPCVVARDGDRDSMPVVVKEAMAMELLVVASDEVGLPECVMAPWGFLAPPGDAPALAEALRAALALDPRERAAAGAAARAWVLANADVDAETATMASLIERVGGRRAPAGAS